ncbi:unnamed protein product [Penicillium olsonii]|uniref:Uncharacterized protein n=1 Tax=Penicillium olsonii TaxID=99116 RepID=A0A9W4MM45_PENOL|nr:unnamed protein product [Penicillium olsonii]CAG8068460.1 unnamed protein product [Penicillium olsonii]
MDVLPPGSRLAVVRSQLALSSSPESSSPPKCTPPFSDKEPFPDYDEAECDEFSVTAAENAEAWAYALGKAVRSEIRQHQIDPNIIPHVQTDPSERSQAVLERMKELLSDPHMRQQTRRQFITLSNITLQVNQVIFHQSPEFLAPVETSDAKLLTETILVHIAWMDNMLSEQCHSVNYTASVLSQIEQSDVSAYEKLREMANVVAGHLKKPRPLERDLLEVYLELYEEWVHTPFLHLRNRQTLTEETLRLDRAELSRHVIAIWDIVSRCVESYDTYIWGTTTIRNEYFATPVVNLNGVSDIWEQCWNTELTMEPDSTQSNLEVNSSTFYEQ